MSDVAEVRTEDISEEKALQLVEQWIADGTVEMPEDTPVLIHTPSAKNFESAVNLAHFHRGWVAREESTASS
jgi:hypothetical protein